MKKKEGVVYHSGYYRLASVFKYMRYGVLLLLAVFTLITFAAFRQDMTEGHFRYFLNNFDFSAGASETSGEVFYYDADADASFGFVSGGLVTLTDSRVFVTDRSSSTTLSAYHGYRQPIGAYSDAYMVLYDRKGSTVTVYNAFSLLKTFTYDGTITLAACADNGNFAVAVSDSGGYYTRIFVYDRDFTMIRTLSKYKYVTALTFMGEGDALLIGSRFTDNGKTGYELQSLDVDTTVPTFTLTLSESVYAIKAGEGGFSALAEGAILSYDEDGTLLKRTAYSALPHKSILLRGGALLATGGSDSRQERLTYYTEAASHEISLKGRLRSAEEDANYVYLLTEEGLFAFDKKAKEVRDLSAVLPTEEAVTLVSNGERVYLAYSHRADRLDGAKGA